MALKLASIWSHQLPQFLWTDVKDLISTLADVHGDCSIIGSYKLDTANSICPSRVRAMLASRACRSSVMIGDPLGRNEMQKVIYILLIQIKEATIYGMFRMRKSCCAITTESVKILAWISSYSWYAVRVNHCSVYGLPLYAVWVRRSGENVKPMIWDKILRREENLEGQEASLQSTHHG